MIRSFIFNIFYILWTIVIGLIFIIPVSLSSDRKLVFKVARIWAKGLKIALQYVCNLTLRIEGKDNLKEPNIFASKHQSALETIIFNLILNEPVFILKKELLNIPIFGYYIKKCGMIAIDRDGGIKTLRTMLQAVKANLSEGHSVIIFPEGTRTSVKQKVNYNSGIAAIYNLPGIQIVPVGLNTGLFWGRDSFIKKPGTFVFSFLTPIDSNLNKQDFMIHLQRVIEEKSDQLCEQ